MQQFLRYLLVGGFNTIFGYAVFAVLNWLFLKISPYGYLYASGFGSVITISVAFLGLKWFVFKTRGNYLQEWIRCFGVYGTSTLIGFVGLSVLVPILKPHLQRPELASYLAAAILTVLTVLISFFGHRNIS